MDRRTRRLAIITASISIFAIVTTEAFSIAPSIAADATSASAQTTPHPPSYEEGRKAGYRAGHQEGAQRAREERCMVVEVDPPSGNVPADLQGDPYWAEGYEAGYMQGFGAGFLSVCPTGPSLTP